MAKKSTIKSAPDGYKRQGSIDDENFLYLYTQLDELQTQMAASFSALESQMKSSFSAVIAQLAEAEDTIGTRLSSINSSISSQTNSVRAGLDGIIEVLSKED